MPDEVSIIVPVWNGRVHLERLLAGLRAQTHAIDEILVIDNGSQDGSAEAARGLGVRVVAMGANMGFSRAVNRGVVESRNKWIAIVNTDVEPATDWLERLLDAARQPDTWFAAGKILSATERDHIDGSWDALCRGGCAWRVGHGRVDGPEFSAARPIWFAPATATLYRRELFDRIGVFDETFESYLEDIDFGVRCASGNYAGRYVPGAVAYHVGSATLGRWHPEVVRRISRNQVLLLAKYYPLRLLVRFAWPIFVSQALWGVVALRHAALGAYLRGKFTGLKLFRAVRNNAAEKRIDPDRLAAILHDAEREISRVQRRTGFDWYWRLYFVLTSGGAD